MCGMRFVAASSLFVLTFATAAPGKDDVLRERVFFATSEGIFVWASDTEEVETISRFGAYEIEISPSRAIFVGNGGVDSVLSGVTTSGIFVIDDDGKASKYSALAVDDLEFDDAGQLFASNSKGIFRIDADGKTTQLSVDPTSQFVFETLSTVLTTHGCGTWCELFGNTTDRIDLSDGTTTLLSAGGGWDVEILADSRVLISGTSGINDFQMGEWVVLFNDIWVFDFEPTGIDKVFIGNPLSYGGHFFSDPGLFFISLPGGSLTQILEDDINSIEVIIDFDCNGNGVSDYDDIADGVSQDENHNGIPDVCEFGTIIFDHFDDGVIGEEWSVDFQDADGWDAQEIGSELVVDDIDATVVNDNQGDTWAIVTLSQSTGQVQLGDFDAAMQLSWDSEGSDDAMQRLLLRVLDESGNTIASVGYNDAWVNKFGVWLAEIENEQFLGVPQLPPAGESEVSISRSDDQITISWNGVEIATGASPTPVAQLAVEYWYFAFDGGAGISFFGQEAVDSVELVSPTPCLADLNNDNLVDPGDLLVLLGFWGACGDCDECLADLDQDCEVGPSDLITLLGNWGPCPK